MKRRLLTTIVLTAAVGLCSGCASSGHRKVTFTLLGSTFAWEDETIPNDKGKEEWVSGFDQESLGFWLWLTGKNDEPEADSDGG